MRWLEQTQHDMDLLIIDEADAVQRVLETRFVQTEQLVATDEGLVAPDGRTAPTTPGRAGHGPGRSTRTCSSGTNTCRSTSRRSSC